MHKIYVLCNFICADSIKLCDANIFFNACNKNISVYEKKCCAKMVNYIDFICAFRVSMKMFGGMIV